MPLGRKFAWPAVVLIVTAVAAWSIGDNFPALVFLALRAAHFAIHPAPAGCKQRASEFRAKVNLLEQDSKNALKPGAKKDDVARFFASENIPITFNQVLQQREASGSLSFKGLAECENVACGDDASAIQVRVPVDGDGTVVSAPVVVGGYTNCM